MRKKKFLISTYTFMPDIGGVATNKFTLCRALRAAGYDVTVVTLTPGEDNEFEGSRVYRNPNPWTLFRLYWEADIVYLTNHSFKLGWPALLLNRKYGLGHHVSSTFELLEDQRPGLKNRIKRYLAQVMVDKSVHFPNSRYTEATGKNVLRGKVSEVLYPISNKLNVEMTTREAYKARKDGFFAGRLVEEKGAGFLLDNFRLIQDKLGIEKLVIAGDGSAMAQLKAQVAEQKLEGVVFTGALKVAEVEDQMKAAAYVFTPSIWAEPFGIIGVEGVASGAVVVSSDRGGLPEAVGKPGVLFNFEDKASFGKALDDARKLREKILSSDKEFEAYRGLANEHLAQFGPGPVIAAIKRTVG